MKKNSSSIEQDLAYEKRRLKFGKDMYTYVLKEIIRNKEYQLLLNFIPYTEEFEASITLSLFQSTCAKAGEYLISQHRYYEAITPVNKARALDTKAKSIFQLFVKANLKFFNENIEEFSKKDLAEFKQAILPIIEFHKLKHPTHRKIVDTTEHMFRRIDYRIKYVAKEVEESILTYRVQQIKNSLYGDMTSEEVQQE